MDTKQGAESVADNDTSFRFGDEICKAKREVNREQDYDFVPKLVLPLFIRTEGMQHACCNQREYALKEHQEHLPDESLHAYDCYRNN